MWEASSCYSPAFLYSNASVELTTSATAAYKNSSLILRFFRPLDSVFQLTIRQVSLDVKSHSCTLSCQHQSRNPLASYPVPHCSDWLRDAGTPSDDNGTPRCAGWKLNHETLRMLRLASVQRMITAHHHVLAGVSRHNHRAALEGTFIYPGTVRVVPTRLNKTHVNAHAWSMVVAFAILFPAGALCCVQVGVQLAPQHSLMQCMCLAMPSESSSLQCM